MSQWHSMIMAISLFLILHVLNEHFSLAQIKWYEISVDILTMQFWFHFNDDFS